MSFQDGSRDCTCSTAETHFRLIVRGLLADGRFPTPARLAKSLGKVRRRNPSLGGVNLNAKESRWRAHELRLAGYVKNPTTGRWEHSVAA